MPLEAIGPMMRRAVEGEYAVGYFESWNLESLQGVVDAAEETRSPIILGFNGDFLSRPTRQATERLDVVRGAGTGGGRVGLGPLRLDLQRVPARRLGSRGDRRGLQPGHAGRSGGAARGLCRAASRDSRGWRMRGASPSRASSASSRAARVGRTAARRLVPPTRRRRPTFVAATGVDLLAVSVGNVHIMTRGQSGPGPGPARRDPPARRRSRWSSTAARGSPPTPCARPSRWAWPRSTSGPTSSSDTSTRSARRSAAMSPTRIACWASAVRRMSWSPAACAVRDAVLERIGLLGCCGKAVESRSVSRDCCNSAMPRVMMDVVMRMPDLATVDDTVTLVRWLAEVGQLVRRGEPLLEVETDKAILVVESAVAGTLQAIAVPAGAEVATGQLDRDVRRRREGGSAVGRDSGHRRRRRADRRRGRGRLRAARSWRPPAARAAIRGAVERGSRVRSSRGTARRGDRPRRRPTRSRIAGLLARVPAGPLPADGLDPRVRGGGEVPVPRGVDARHDPPVPGPGGDGRGRLRGPGGRATSSRPRSAAMAMPWPRG